MNLFKKNHKEISSKGRSLRAKTENKKSIKLWDPVRSLKIIAFLVFLFAVIGTCFVGQFPAGLQVLPNQIAKIRIVAEYPFSYNSNILTKNKYETIRKQTAPVYSIDESVYQEFETNIKLLSEEINKIELQIANKAEKEQENIINKFIFEFKENTGIYINKEDIKSLLKKISQSKRKQIFEEGLIFLRDVMREGVFQPYEEDPSGISHNQLFYSVDLDKHRKDIKVLSAEDALRYLNVNISALDIDWSISRAFYRIFKLGIKPNLTFDAQQTEEHIKEALQIIEPVNVYVQEGQTIIEPGSLIGPEQIEQLRAYHDFLNKNEYASFGFNVTLQERTTLTIIILLAALLYIHIALPSLARSNRRIAVCAFVVLINLLLIRLVLEIGDTTLFGSNAMVLSVLPFCTPILYGSIIATILLGAQPAILIAALISTFYSLMLGSITSFLVIALTASFTVICLSTEVRQRTKVVRASAFGGLIFALCSFFLGMFYGVTLETISIQIFFSIIIATLTGIAAIGSLPLFEKWFNLTTNITLLELADFNHPLLRRLQIQAPGTYHHSLMVATLAERAALAINANPLMCRACSLYHDIGKIIKPEYFVENQTQGLNPHVEKNPSISALIIKSHVKEGVALAEEYKLPKVIIDTIEQHHGTTLIQYFYEKAQKYEREKENTLPATEENNDALKNEIEIDESTFRYDGPRPQFKESAIISLADSVEAASRSLKKVSSLGIQELIDAIFQERLNDKQLDECDLTFKQITKIRDSFHVSLLNMLHSRIEYPQQQIPNKDNNKKQQTLQLAPKEPSDDTSTTNHPSEPSNS